MVVILCFVILASSCHYAVAGEVQAPATFSSRTTLERKLGRQAGAITLDPVSIISLLALGAFLINNIIQLLRSNQMMHQQPGGTGRSEQFQAPSVLDAEPRFLGMEMKTDKAATTKSEFWNFVGNMGSLYFVKPRNRVICMRKVIFCLKPNDNIGNFHDKILGLILSAATKILIPEGTEEYGSGCQNLNRLCSDTVLENAKVASQTKVYEILSRYAIQRMISG